MFSETGVNVMQINYQAAENMKSDRRRISLVLNLSVSLGAMMNSLKDFPCAEQTGCGFCKCGFGQWKNSMFQSDWKQ